MESRRVAEEREWDQLRLRDVRSDRATYARDYAHQVIVAISPYLSGPSQFRKPSPVQPIRCGSSTSQSGAQTTSGVGDVNAMVSVIEEVSKVQRKTGNHPIVVHGLNTVVKAIRAQKPGAIQTLEQYKSIFEALLAYMKHTQILLLRRVIAISSCNTIVVLVFSSLHDVDLLLRSCSQLPMRMRVKGGVDEGGWTNTESKMESRRVAEEREWDQLRLRDVRSDRATYARDYAHQVIVAISPYLLLCKCVEQLLPHLVRRGVVASKVRSIILSQSDTEAASSLERLLYGRSREQGVEVSMVEGVYLALLDCYEESGSVWCHGMAVSGIQPVVRFQLKLPDINFDDLAVLHQRVSSTNLPEGDAAMLTEKLGLSNYGTLTDLKKIIQIAFSTRVSFHKLVSALLLTRHTGRYLSLLLPYCRCNPPCVYEVIQALGQNWVTLAVYLGYSEVEFRAIARAGGEDPHRQIQMFMRVWWMPDCGTEETVGLLNQFVHGLLRITSQPILVKVSHWDKGLALLKACLDNDWGKAEALIKAGTLLDARSEDGRTPLMLACLKMKEKIVQLLIDHGADVQVKDKRGEACLNYIETLRNQYILECILKEYRKLGASVDVESKHVILTFVLYTTTARTQGVPLSLLPVSVEPVASAELLLKYGANPNGCENGRHRPLVEASAQGHMGLVNALLKCKADVDATAQDGYTALLQACKKNHWYLAQVLIKEGADVNKCTSEGISPLFVAVEANEYGTASKLIQKGASVNLVKFQSGALDGIVELTPLAQAAAKGLNAMVQLLLDSGANINYFCADTLPALGFTIIGDHVETFHLLLSSPNLVKTLAGLSSVIITSVRTEKYYYTEKLLEILGGPQAAVMQAQQDHLQLLVENIAAYMRATYHPDLREVESILLVPNSTRHQLRQLELGPGEQEKIKYVLTDFCRICVSAILYSPEVHISTENLIGIAQATGNVAVANFLQRTLSGPMVDEELQQKFLMGEPSPLRFLIENKVFKLDIFQIEVLKFHPDDSDIFYKDLVWTFQHMSGGANLPDRESRLPLEKTGRLVRDNQPLPREESKSENILSENMRNNLPNRSRRYTNAPFSAQSSFVGVEEVSTTDKARSKAMKLVQVKEINMPVSAFPQCKSAAIANSDDATQPMYHPFVSLMSPPVSSFQYQSGTGTDSSRSSSLATGSSYNPGLQHLHQQKPAIIHRDLTANNVLLKNGVAKIGDFGNSRIVDLKTSEPLTTRPGTIDYMPPEAMEGGLYNEKLDIFSYSHLVIHEVCYQYWPGKRGQTYGEFRVELLSEGWKSGFLFRNFSVQQAKFAIAHQVWQFHIPEWSSDYQWRGDVNAIVSVIEEVSKVRRKTGNHPIVVHGLDTVSRSAIFCGVATTIERCKTEGVVDVFQVVKAMRVQKPGAIQTLLSGKTRKVTHFHYTAWPDHGVPDYATSILNFHEMGYKKHRAFIITQGPMRSTARDFWKMVYSRKCSVVVMLSDLIELDEEVCYQYWPGKRAQTYGEFRVELLSEGWKSGFLFRNSSVQQAKFATAHQVWQFHIPEWNSDYQWCGDVNAMVSVIEEVSKVQRKTGNHPIVIHGLDTVSRSAIFCGVATTIERCKTEGVVDVFQVVKAMRVQKPGALQTVEQYQSIYEALLVFIDSFETYSNFTT
ncbi:Receptor-type tyrosine-protein phosphatase alpha [Geodia barretti]|uniref:Receptor-type tyrosine-protein phosphatase alpha n=1 Tax=Geodia barretti TaxID=519541 RepID=A0AA35RWY5_GEOBA|nr:Receptor-type tyrosine-protein phosphatase alpha [Geodia barretti]